MMDIINKEIEAYSERHTSEESLVLEHINRDTHVNVLLPRMLSGKYQGRLLATWSHMMQPKRILEIGTFTGYSCLCLAEGQKEKGQIDTIDINEELEERVRGYFNSSEYNDKINYTIGNAMDIVPTLKHTYDLVFIDADKINYKNYYEMVLDKVRPNGIIIADNVLWSGKVLGPPHIKKMDKDTDALIKFNDFVQQDSRVENILVAIRDGLLICRKK